MANAFVQRLVSLAPLSEDEQREAESLTSRAHAMRARESMAVDGGEPPIVHAMLSGWACRATILPDGRRQITSIHLPGDPCEFCAALFGGSSPLLSTLTPAVVAKVPSQALRDAMLGRGRLGEALWRSALVAMETQREWVVNLGRRTAVERLAYFFCETSARLAAVGLSNGPACEIPLTQTDLADITGLSTVHVNRSLQDLRASGLIDFRSKRLVVHDRRALTDLAMFDGAYLRAQKP